MILTCTQCERTHDRNASFQCECGWKFVFPGSRGAEAPDLKEALAKQGRESWRLLHGMAFIEMRWDPAEQEKWWNDVWKQTIPSYGCNCNSEFEKIISSRAPIFTNRTKYYEWTVWAHNEVNRRIKPLQPLWVITNELQRLSELESIHDLQASV